MIWVKDKEGGYRKSHKASCDNGITIGFDAINYKLEVSLILSLLQTIATCHMWPFDEALSYDA